MQQAEHLYCVSESFVVVLCAYKSVKVPCACLRYFWLSSMNFLMPFKLFHFFEFHTAVITLERPCQHASGDYPTDKDNGAITSLSLSFDELQSVVLSVFHPERLYHISCIEAILVFPFHLFTFYQINKADLTKLTCGASLPSS